MNLIEAVVESNLKEVVKILSDESIDFSSRGNNIFKALVVSNSVLRSFPGEQEGTCIKHELLKTLHSRLLSNETIQEMAASENNIALFSAVEFQHWELASRLLEIDAVRNAIMDIKILSYLIIFEKLEILQSLLTIPSMRELLAANSHEVLLATIRTNNETLVDFFLDFDSIKKTATAYNNEALQLALPSKPIFHRLLKIESVQKLFLANYTKALKDAIYHGHDSVVDSILAIDTVRKEIAGDANQTLLKFAAQNFRFSSLQKLLSDPSIRHNPNFPELKKRNFRIQMSLNPIITENRAALEFIKQSLRGNTHFSTLPDEIFEMILSYVLPARGEGAFRASFDSLMDLFPFNPADSSGESEEDSILGSPSRSYSPAFDAHESNENTTDENRKRNREDAEEKEEELSPKRRKLSDLD
jgi:hypothetical protein